ncbi:MAG: acyl-CoA thioesterase [Candidatus Omnitrophica bacterium]|nr:acyl-CoA thioesterase [Candidatus Omnitrophota bacterium]
MKTQIRVRYQETDRMGVVYYGNYFTWFEVARTEYFRELGLPYTRLEKEGIRLMVADAKCTYKSPATYDDLLTIETQVVNIKNTSLSFSYKIYRDEKTLISLGESTHVFTDERGRPTRIPAKVKEVLNVSA